jgi:hypothetical protein
MTGQPPGLQTSGLQTPDDMPVTRPSVVARVMILLVRIYRGYSAHRSPACRFTPSCAQYTLEALEAHGAWRGTGLALRRLGRCRPGGPFGYDPVPEAVPGPSDKEKRP